jgi:hypothetical protein
MLNSAMRKAIREEVERVVRDEKFAAVDRRLERADELETNRIPTQQSLIAQIWADGIEAARTETPKVGDLVDAVVWLGPPDDETGQQRDDRLTALAAERYRKELQTERHSREADRAAAEWIGAEPAEWIGAEPAEDGDETVGLASRLRDLLPRRSRQTDPEPRAEIF